MDQSNQVAVPVPPTPAGPPYGTEHIEKLLDVAVSGYQGFKSFVDGDSVMQKVMKMMPTLLVVAAAAEALKLAGPEFKDITGEEIKAISVKYAPKFNLSGDIVVYVEEGANILGSVLKIVKAIKA